MIIQESVELLTDEIRCRFVKDFLDMVILQLVETEPTWGYDIIKKTQTRHKVKLRHGALYPMLNRLRKKGLIKSKKELEKGRVRKVYQITERGKQLLNGYHDFLKEQVSQKTIKKSLETPA